MTSTNISVNFVYQYNEGFPIKRIQYYFDIEFILTTTTTCSPSNSDLAALGFFPAEIFPAGISPARAFPRLS